MSTYSQMLKGIMEGCILEMINQKERYGYELSQKLSQHGFPHISEGSIYPLLLRMQKEGLIEGSLIPSQSGPRRKYYRLTQKGEKTLAEFTHQWDALKRAVDNVLEPNT
ncbi:PadR family transcriptional regulator [Marininema halotolerans]|uniref:PadR family transcriptional regulator, regulatory protein PadR n=1 Tax=Marininema halotolerans TaxID=1155944 RepID=A0A1I6RFZ1_9BACL|nr:PadR family transcriptional regulator [Marininema halotolerans]SFS63500.1 PadR family transcriptional regulator, regulatory protein PadR [Marininema halotolerans]